MFSEHHIKEIKISFFTVFFNLDNGKYMTIDNDKLNNCQYVDGVAETVGFLDPRRNIVLTDDHFPVITLTLNLSNKCNLNCTYCFRNSNADSKKEIALEECTQYIDFIMNSFPKSKHFHVDLTGDGEPLLRFDLIKQLIEYTEIKSIEGRTIQIGLCTNGTLLTKEITKYFEQHEIYYGISIDGNKAQNDYYRKGYTDKSVYQTIIKNLKMGHSKYRGAAVTITNRSTDFVNTFKKLTNNFDVVTMKPVRSSSIDTGEITQNNVTEILDEYTDLYNFIIRETLQDNVWYLLSIIRDEDLLGKFIRRVILNQSAIVRCGGGTNKFALSNNDIYICGAAADIPGLRVGSVDSGFDEKRVKELFETQLTRKNCSDCWAQYICGGPCLVHSLNKYGVFDVPDETICMINKHLIKLAFLFRQTLIKERENLFYRIYEICMDNHYR